MIGGLDRIGGWENLNQLAFLGWDHQLWGSTMFRSHPVGCKCSRCFQDAPGTWEVLVADIVVQKLIDTVLPDMGDTGDTPKAYPPILSQRQSQPVFLERIGPGPWVFNYKFHWTCRRGLEVWPLGCWLDIFGSSRNKQEQKPPQNPEAASPFGRFPAPLISSSTKEGCSCFKIKCMREPYGKRKRQWNDIWTSCLGPFRCLKVSVLTSMWQAGNRIGMAFRVAALVPQGNPEPVIRSCHARNECTVGMLATLRPFHTENQWIHLCFSDIFVDVSCDIYRHIVIVFCKNPHVSHVILSCQ